MISICTAMSVAVSVKVRHALQPRHSTRLHRRAGTFCATYHLRHGASMELYYTRSGHEGCITQYNTCIVHCFMHSGVPGEVRSGEGLMVQLIRTTNWKSGYPAIGKAVENAQDEISATGACARRIAVTWARVPFPSTPADM